jgi:hypothetical protein
MGITGVLVKAGINVVPKIVGVNKIDGRAIIGAVVQVKSLNTIATAGFS